MWYVAADITRLRRPPARLDIMPEGAWPLARQLFLPCHIFNKQVGGEETEWEINRSGSNTVPHLEETFLHYSSHKICRDMLVIVFINLHIRRRLKVAPTPSEASEASTF